MPLFIMEILNDFLTQIILGTGFGGLIGKIIADFYKKRKLEKRAEELQKENKEIRDNQQDKRMLILEKKIDKDIVDHEKIMTKLVYIENNIKDSVFEKSLKLLLEEKTAILLKIKDVKNTELIRLLNNGLCGYMELTAYILLTQF